MDGQRGSTWMDTGRFGDGLDDEWLGSLLGFYCWFNHLFVYGSEAGLVSWALVNPVNYTPLTLHT
jgi:hypothetical protein